jgi:hypothetical protein
MRGSGYVGWRWLHPGDRKSEVGVAFSADSMGEVWAMARSERWAKPPRAFAWGEWVQVVKFRP